jgi:type 2 lantibiotic biosynthesis protein LanM
VRVILRPSRTYGLLLRESFHPDLLRNALDRDRFFDWLWVAVKQCPPLARVIRAERDDLQRGDIPLFTTRPNSRDVWGGARERVADFFDEPGMALVQGRLWQLREEDLTQQLWFIRASLATLSRGAEPKPRSAFRLLRPQARADRGRLLAAARAVGDRLEALALQGTQDATWIGLTLGTESQWSLLPLGMDLYDGLPGVALFLAYLGTLTGEERYTALAQAAVTGLRRQVESNQSVLTAVGGFNGWGGVIYTYTHLAALWQQPALGSDAAAVVEWLPPLIERDEHLDVIEGAAGCIGGLLSLDRCAPSPRTRAMAIHCGNRLLACQQALGRGSAWVTRTPAAKPLTGFAHGAAGMAWALLELAAVTGLERFRAAARAALAYERSLFSPEARNWPDLRDGGGLGLPGDNKPARFQTAWCYGAPGIGLARLRALSHGEDGELRAEIDAALQTTLAQGFGDNHSLCHGDLGNLELLVQAGETLAGPPWRAEVDRLAALILESISRDGWRCGNPLRVESPGLMTGLAGIGYGLLRLAEPARVPSVLLLEPPAGHGVRPERAMPEGVAALTS